MAEDERIYLGSKDQVTEIGDTDTFIIATNDGIRRMAKAQVMEKLGINQLAKELVDKSKLSLGIDSIDNMLYIFYDGEAVGEGVNVDGATGTRYNVTYSLGNATVSYNPKTVAEGKTFTTVITAKDGYSIQSVIVTMGGEDITTTSYMHGVVTVSSVTGEITITVTTKALPKDIDNTKIFNMDLTGWTSAATVTDTIGEKSFDVTDETATVHCSYYGTKDEAETAITKNGWTVALVWDRNIRPDVQFYNGINNAYTNVPTGSYAYFACVRGDGPFYNGSGATSVYITEAITVTEWYADWSDLPDINNLIVSYGNDGTVKWYLNGELIYTFTCSSWSNWKNAGSNIFFNPAGGFKIQKNASGSRFEGVTRMTVYEGSVTDEQASQLSNFFLS